MLDSKAVAEVLRTDPRRVNNAALRLNLKRFVRYPHGYKRMFDSDDIDRIKADLQSRKIIPPDA